MVPPGSESTLRIDEPLHLMFLVAYLITYFCCAYILFVCFKHCRRLVQRKPSRPVNFSRLRSVAEALNNLPRRNHTFSQCSANARHVQVSLCRNLGGTHAVLCPEYQDEGEMSQSALSVSDTTETNVSTLSPLPPTTFTFRRIYFDQRHTPITCLIINDDEIDDDDDDDDDELPGYDSVLNPLPPSYSTCVLSNSALTCPSATTTTNIIAPATTNMTTTNDTITNINGNSCSTTPVVAEEASFSCIEIESNKPL